MRQASPQKSRICAPSHDLPLTCDKLKRTDRNRTKIFRAQRQYENALSSLGEHVGQLIVGYPLGDPSAIPSLTQLLQAYSEALSPWAKQVASRMIGEVDARDRDAWRSLGNAISSQLHVDISKAPVGERMRSLLDEQVALIQSIPREAAERVHKLTLEGLENSSRGEDIIRDLLRSPEVTVSRAVLIARTETSRTAAVLKQTRAESAGSTHFIWHTVGDGTVRADHKLLNGRVFAWDDPPIADQRTGARALPGAIYNCRCWPQAVISG